MSEARERLHEILERSREELRGVILGQEEAIDLALVTLFSGAHGLVEGVPGVAKTLLVRALSQVFAADFSRIQFTPDLMPTDITGTSVFDLAQREFRFVPGPIFAAFLLADEINRAPAKTQSALLQAMQERQVTVDRVTHPLPDTFTVFATQNPVEFEGTYPLPEAQKDRFLLKILMGAPSREAELELAHRSLGPTAPERVVDEGRVRAIATLDELAAARAHLEELTVRDEVRAYAVDLVRSTRDNDGILIGAGPRATMGLLAAARAWAALDGRDFVTPDDIRSMVGPVLAHRLVLRPELELEGIGVEEVLESTVGEVAVPR